MRYRRLSYIVRLYQVVFPFDFEKKKKEILNDNEEDGSSKRTFLRMQKELERIDGTVHLNIEDRDTTRDEKCRPTHVRRSKRDVIIIQRVIRPSPC